MNTIANLLFEAKMLKHINRTGYSFLGSGRESVAEHSFMICIIAYVMGRMNPDINQEKLLSMCILHDLPEARTGDLNYVNKKYVTANEKKAIDDLSEGLFFGNDIRNLLHEFNRAETKEAKLAKDADQLSFILELKAQKDRNSKTAGKWLTGVAERVKTKTGKKILKEILETERDGWWFPHSSDK